MTGSDTPPRSWKVEAIRKAWAEWQRSQDDKRPDVAADRAVARFEADAIKTPAALEAPAGVPDWQRLQYSDAARLYRLVAVAPEGVTLADLTGSIASRKRSEQALRLLRQSGAVCESREPRERRDGRVVDLIVLRAT